jgi:hypothetical protein
MMHSVGDLFRYSQIKALAGYLAHDPRVVDLNSESN